MKIVKANYEEFVYNLSAFISASRSITQYMHLETTTNGNSSWYESKMINSDILKFFKSTRDLNIHIIPYQLQKHVTVQVNPLTLTASIASTSISSSGQVVFASIPASSSSSSSSSSSKSNSQESKSIDVYKFDPNWYDQIKTNEQYTEANKDLCKRICQSYDVITFCETYLNELEVIMNEGISKSFIS